MSTLLVVIQAHSEKWVKGSILLGWASKFNDKEKREKPHVSLPSMSSAYIRTASVFG